MEGEKPREPQYAEHGGLPRRAHTFVDPDDILPQVKPVFLSIRHPLVADARGGTKDDIEGYYDLVDSVSYGRRVVNGRLTDETITVDGLILKNVVDMPNQALHLPPVPSTVMAVRMPNQAKSAIGNQGTFSADSDALLDSAAIPAADTFHLIAEGAAILQRLDENSPTFWADLRRGREILALIGDGLSVPQSEAERQLQEVEQRYADVLKAHDETGAPLPAPNGQPSKLNRRQWLQVRTPAFKNWFGDWERDENKPVAVTRIEIDKNAPKTKNAAAWRNYALSALRGKKEKIIDNGVEVEFLRNGIQAASKNRNENARALLAGLPEVLKKSVYLGYAENTKEDAKPGVVGYEYYVAAVELSGKIREVRLTVDLVRGFTRGRGYYYHQVGDVVVGDEVGYTPALKAASPPNHTVRLGDLREFGKPFAISQAVDANGEPLVVYQGGKVDFDRFDPLRTSNEGGLLFFTDSPQLASLYEVPPKFRLPRVT